MRPQGERGDHLDQSAEKVYDLNLELDVSAHLHSLAAFLSPTLPFVLTPPTPHHHHGAIPQCNPPSLQFYPLYPPPSTPTLFSSPTPPVYLFFHQIELAESKGIPAIPSQS